MRKPNLVLAALLAAALCGCSDPIVASLSRPNGDPTQSTLSSTSSASEYTVKLEWDADPAATEYRIYRSNTPTSEKTLLYYGNKPEFTDSEAPPTNNLVYFYFLEKARGNKAFPMSAAEMGFKSTTVLDASEPNDTADKATAFGKVAEANLYLFKQGEYLKIDYDWYSVEIGPHEIYQISFTNVSASPPAIVLLVEGGVAQNYDSGTAISLSNPTDANKTVKFRFSISTESLGSDVKTFHAYKLNLVHIVVNAI